MKRIVVDGLNRVLSPVCAFFSGCFAVEGTLNDNLAIILFCVSMAFVMGSLSYMAWKYSIQYPEFID